MNPTYTPEFSPLGKKVEYQDHYDASLLFPIARQQKRDEIGVAEHALPFTGVDLWTGYELSWLNGKGKPQVAIATFRIPADSPRLIESKSFKLYLNSYNQTRIDSWQQVAAQLELDLSNAAGGKVAVSLLSPAEFGGEHYIITGLANGWTQLTHQTAEIVWGFLLRSCWERRGEMHYQNLVNMMTGVSVR